MRVSDIHSVYFLGIGGIGMSALARYFRARGCRVYGYDRTCTPLTRELEGEGMKIHYEESIERIPDQIDLVVYTPAIPRSNAEWRFFREGEYRLVKRAEVLGMISREWKAMAIAGTHGKTTVSAMTAHLLKSGGVDCTAFLGGIAVNYDSNFLMGKSDWVVVEADEYDRSFLHLSPQQAVILSMDPDHLDIYGDGEQMLESGFKAFAGRLKDTGDLWVKHGWHRHFAGHPQLKVFGLEAGDYRAENIRVEGDFFAFDYQSPGQKIKDMKLARPGKHNVENATAAICLVESVGVSPESIREGLKSFKGIRRRFEIVHRDGEMVYVDDYAHHPSELKAAIDAARQFFPGKKITGVFQPHLYSRTRDFVDGFAEALDQLDEVILLDIYPAREEPIRGVDSRLILDRMSNPQRRMSSKERLLSELEEMKPGVLMTLGAGDIDRLVQPIGEFLRQRNEN